MHSLRIRATGASLLALERPPSTFYALSKIIVLSTLSDLDYECTSCMVIDWLQPNKQSSYLLTAKSLLASTVREAQRNMSQRGSLQERPDPTLT